MARLPITAGVEIEFNTSDHSHLYRAGYNTRAIQFDPDNFPGWKLTTDGSCGYELVSPVCRQDTDLDKVEAVVADLNAKNAKVDRRCGLHVHIGLRGYAPERIERLLQFLVRYEESFFLLASDSRRTGSYCKPLADFLFDWLNSGQALALWSDHYRYHWINMSALREHGTIEFRLMDCKLDAKFIRGWMEFLMTLCYKLLNDGKTVSRAKSKVAFKRSEVKEKAMLMHDLLVKSEAFYGSKLKNPDMAKRARTWASDRFCELHGYRHKTAINKAQMAKVKARQPSPEDEYAYSRDGYAYNAAGERIYGG